MQTPTTLLTFKLQDFHPDNLETVIEAIIDIAESYPAKKDRMLAFRFNHEPHHYDIYWMRDHPQKAHSYNYLELVSINPNNF